MVLAVCAAACMAALVQPPYAPHAPPHGACLTHAARAGSPLCAHAEGAEFLLPVLREAGLDELQAQTVWEKRPRGRLPNAQKQERLLEWIQARMGAQLAHLPPAMPSYLMLTKAPRLLLRAGTLLELDSSHEALQELLGQLKPRQMAMVFTHTPELLLLPADALRHRAAALSSCTGLTEKELERTLSSTPRLLLSAPESLEVRVKALKRRLSLDEGRLRRVVSRAPLALQLSARNLEARLDFLSGLGLEPELASKLVVRSPRLLHSPLAELRRRVQWLSDEAELPLADRAAWLEKQPDFFSITEKGLAARLLWLRSQDLTESQAAAAVRDEPKVLTEPQETMELRLAFYQTVLGGQASDLAKVPHLLTCDLGRVAMLRHAYCLANGLVVQPTELLVKGNSIFCMEVAGCSEEDLLKFEAEGLHLQFYQGAAL